MKLQFSTSSLLIAIGFIAITIGGILAVYRAYSFADPLAVVVALFVVQSPLWMPMVFLGYVAGRRKMTFKVLIAFALVQTGAVVAMLLFPGYR
jgi:uncharacterized membrane protein